MKERNVRIGWFAARSAPPTFKMLFIFPSIPPPPECGRRAPRGNVSPARRDPPTRVRFGVASTGYYTVLRSLG